MTTKCLIWKKASDWHLESECGRYTVSKTMLDKIARYTAWLKGVQAEALGRFGSAAEAKACADAHARRQA